ncbi:MAG TPA: glycosyltransferase family 39 protein [Anaerolineae bacterium]
MAEQTVTPAARRHRIWMSAVLIVFGVLCLLYNVTLPLFEAPDEGDHFAYASLLVRTGRLPDLTADLATSHEIIQPPLYYALAAAVIAPFDLSNQSAIMRLNPDWFDADVNADHRSVTNQYLHTQAELFPYQGAVWAVHAARLVSTVLGGLTLLLIGAIARLALNSASSSRSIPLLKVILVALNPKFIHISSIVSNDIAITFSATLACWWMLHLARHGQQRAGYFILGAIIGIAMLSKVTGLGLLAPAGLLVLLSALRERRLAFPLVLRRGLQLAAGLFIVAGPWLGWNLMHYGNPLAWAQVQAANQSLLRASPLTLAQMVQAIPEILISYWGVIGVELRYPAWVDLVFYGALGLAVIGIGIRLAHARFNATIQTWSAPLLILLTWEVVLLVSYIWWLRDYTATENSRLIFPGIALVAYAVAAGWTALPSVAPRIVATSFCVGMLALSALTPFTTLLPAFATPAYLNAQQRTALSGQNGITFAGKIHLQHAQVNDRAVKPGEYLNVTLFWGAVQPLQQSFRTILAARDAQGQLIGRLEAIPFNGRFDTQRWEPGLIFRDDYRLRINPDARRGMASVTVSVRGIYETPPLLGIDGAGTDQFIIGPFKVLGKIEPAVAPQLPVSAQFSDSKEALIQLDGIDTRSADGKPMLALHWRCLKQPGRDYTLFVHIIDHNGQIIAQEDGQPFNGAYPTGMWDEQEQLVDVHAIALPAGAESLRIGWYAPESGARLSARKPDGAPWPDNAVTIPWP